MSNDKTILDGFASNLQKLLEATIAEKSEELKQRETIIKEREDKVDHILKNNHTKGFVELRVGSVIYYTSTDILLKHPDSYFHGMLSKKFKEDSQKDFYFIARDGEIFKYVLEYLTYGKLFSVPPDEESIAKLQVDADFYLLPELVKELDSLSDKLEKSKGTTANQTSGTPTTIWMRVGCQQAFGNGSYINWASIQHLPSTHFTQSGNTTTILKAGLYHIFVRYEYQCSTHGQGSANVDLYLNGNVVARAYHGKSDGYIDSRVLEHLTPISENGRVQVFYRSNSNGAPNADPMATTLTIIRLA